MLVWADDTGPKALCPLSAAAITATEQATVEYQAAIDEQATSAAQTLAAANAEASECEHT